MENIKEKAEFLKKDYTAILSQLDVETTAKWGKMNVQQMIEHMSDYVRIANGRTPMEVVTPEERLPLMQEFLKSEKQMRENTKNALMSETPTPVKHSTKTHAIKELQGELEHFFAVHEKESGRKTANPFFGELEYSQQVQLLHKHATHHLRQFGAAG